MKLQIARLYCLCLFKTVSVCSRFQELSDKNCSYSLVYSKVRMHNATGKALPNIAMTLGSYVYFASHFARCAIACRR